MILPTKRLSQDRSLLYVGAEILQLVDEPKTVSRLWRELQSARSAQSGLALLTYDWFCTRSRSTVSDKSGQNRAWKN